jgi:polar amino acid transport system substrate-binding protein
MQHLLSNHINKPYGAFMVKHPDQVWKQLFINLSRHVDIKVTYSGTHSAHVAYWVKATARLLNLPNEEIQIIYWASLLHDLGKISVPDEILSKNGPLSDDEWVLMKLHPIAGANMVNSLGSLTQAAPIVKYHQEKYDGSGYPKGLQGEEIPFGARILAVIDAYDAMTNTRVYRQARKHEEAIKELESKCGSHFDPIVVDIFLKTLEYHTYPLYSGIN